VSPRQALGIALTYFCSLLQGLTLVAFPASATVLRSEYGIDDAGYGSLFLPQMAFTIAGSLASASLASRLGLKTLLAISTLLAASAAAALASVSIVGADARLPILLVGTGLMGAGFGLAAAPLNALPARFFPSRADAALVALHTSMGAGLALGPLIVSAIVASGAWRAMPIGLACVATIAASLVLAAAFPSAEIAGAASTPVRVTPRATFSLLLVVAVLYAFCEGTFASWASVFLAEDRHVDPRLAALALSAFWASIAIGRLLVAAIVVRVPAERVWVALLVLIALAFGVVPLAHDASSGIAVFALAGLACSAFFPLTVGIGARLHARPETAASMLVAALMIGVGCSSFALGALRARLSLEEIYRLSIAYPLVALVLAFVVVRRARVTT